MAAAAMSPATERTGSGHQLGGEAKPRSSGSVLKTQLWAMATSFRKK